MAETTCRCLCSLSCVFISSGCYAVSTHNSVTNTFRDDTSTTPILISSPKHRRKAPRLAPWKTARADVKEPAIS